MSTAKAGADLFARWLQPLLRDYRGITLYGERRGARAIGLAILKLLLAEHFVGEATIVRAGGYEKAAAIICNSLPANKRTRAGDLGELLATEYVSSETPFMVPIKKLRWKSDRQMPMHGNDVIAVDARQRPVRVLKCESKSRAAFSRAVVEEAAKALDLYDGRPNPSTLAFIAKRLYEEGRDKEANVFRDLQCGAPINTENINHLIFALAGNDPSQHLASGPRPRQKGITRANAAIVVSHYGSFITAVYEQYGARS